MAVSRVPEGLVERLLPREVELRLLAGFVDPGRPLGHGERKSAAARLRARVATVEVAVEFGPRAPLRLVAERVGVSERNLHRQFPIHEALLAFPPPELAQAMASLAAPATVWSEVAVRVRPLFEALDTNRAGRALMAGLVVLHREHHWLRAADGYFASELRDLVEASVERTGSRAVALVGYFTEGVRSAFEVWAERPSESVMVVADAVAELIAAAPVWPR